jgi:uncharacterized damage-inducible protein DinB
MPVSEIERIIDQLEREHDGDPWHGSPLLAILADMSAEQAASSPIGGAHSIWELVLHMAAWKNEVAKRVSGAPAGLPEEGDWPEVGEATGKRWHEALNRLQQAHDRLMSAVRSLPAERLHEPTNDPRNRPLGSGVSYYVMLHGIVQHDVYHAGQIAILKKHSSAGS